MGENDCGVKNGVEIQFKIEFPTWQKTPFPLWFDLLWVQAPATELHKYGGIAQLGERLNGIQEVSGSIPLTSTNKNNLNWSLGCFYW